MYALESRGIEELFGIQPQGGVGFEIRPLSLTKCQLNASQKIIMTIFV